MVLEWKERNWLTLLTCWPRLSTKHLVRQARKGNSFFLFPLLFIYVQILLSKLKYWFVLLLSTGAHNNLLIVVFIQVLQPTNLAVGQTFNLFAAGSGSASAKHLFCVIFQRDRLCFCRKWKYTCKDPARREWSTPFRFSENILCSSSYVALFWKSGWLSRGSREGISAFIVPENGTTIY